MISIKNFDWWWLGLFILIILLGSVAILSVNPIVFPDHLFFVLISILVFLILSFTDLKIIENFSLYFYPLTLLLLLLPIFLGIFSRGAVRWVQIGSYTFQPSEFCKPLLAMFFAKYWVLKEFNLKTLIKYLFLLFIPVILIFRQPDLGSSLVVFVLGLGVLFFSKINWSQLLILGLILLAFLPPGWFFLKDYQKVRLVHFFNPSSDPLGAGYNITQATIAIGSGKLTGKGLGKGTQSHLAFLPERHTDFIFASFAEEFGLIGSFSLLTLYSLLLSRLLKIARESLDPFLATFCFGIFFFVFFQIFVNIGMNLGLLPITGITLPLFSYGGSSLISTAICLGLIGNVTRMTRKSPLVEIGRKSTG